MIYEHNGHFPILFTVLYGPNYQPVGYIIFDKLLNRRKDRRSLI